MDGGTDGKRRWHFHLYTALSDMAWTGIPLGATLTSSTNQTEVKRTVEFQHAYKAFIKFHRKNAYPGTRERIEVGLQHAEQTFLENVWWPAFRNFDDLHPEYEILDFKDGRRYIDFAYIRPQFRIAIEIDGIGTHWKNISADQFSDHCHRQNHLIIDGWHVLRFAYRDVRQSPRFCQQTVQQLLGRLTGTSSSTLEQLNFLDQQIVRFTLSQARPVTVAEVETHIGLKKHATIRHLKRLSAENWLVPARGRQRIHAYRIHPTRTNIQL